jgi:hypothetical protein
MKKLRLISIFFAASFGIISCGPAYVGVAPANTVIVRPASPNVRYVWRDGDWRYNRNTRKYVYRNGYWAAPRRNGIYQPGYWRNTPRGTYWVPGRWR